MKRKCLCLFALAGCLAICAQEIKVINNEELPVSATKGYFNPVLSPTGDFLLVTSEDLQGLQKYDLATRQFTPITSDAGAGSSILISPDGNTLVYRTKEYKNRLRYTSLYSVDLNTGKKTELIKETRNLEGVAIKEGTVLAVDNGKLKTKRLGGSKLKTTPPVASIKQGKLYVTQHGKTELVSPAGKDANYLWSSVSPDGTKLLYYVINKAQSYVSDIDGSNPVSLGILRAPKWMGNDWIVGMVDYDNGEIVTSSKIVAVSANGTARTDLTPDSVIATYPTASADASKVLYHTGDGKIYLMHVETSK